MLELSLAGGPDEQTLADVALAAHALAYVVIANRRFTDLFAWGQRSVPLSLAAEIQHRLLPGSYTCEAGQFTLAAWLEPAGDVGGDTFDFSIDRDTLHLSMTDAMGHEVGAAVLATVLVGALRNARRAGVGLAEQARPGQRGAPRLRPQGRRSSPASSRGSTCATQTATIVNAGSSAAAAAARRSRRARGTARPTRRSGSCRGHEYRVQPLPLRARRPDDVRHRRHARAQRRRRRHRRLMVAGAEMHPREAVQHLSRRSSRRPAASSRTTRPPCASTGMAGRRERERPTLAPTLSTRNQKSVEP